MRLRLRTSGATLFLCVALLGGQATPVTFVDEAPSAPAPNAPYGGWDEGTQPGVLVGVRWIRGSSDDGFRIRWSDGSTTFTPTRSEELAECTEYHNRLRRGRCEGAARASHRWMGELKRSLRMHHANH